LLQSPPPSAIATIVPIVPRSLVYIYASIAPKGTTLISIHQYIHMYIHLCIVQCFVLSYCTPLFLVLGLRRLSLFSLSACSHGLDCLGCLEIIKRELLLAVQIADRPDRSLKLSRWLEGKKRESPNGLLHPSRTEPGAVLASTNKWYYGSGDPWVREEKDGEGFIKSDLGDSAECPLLLGIQLASGARDRSEFKPRSLHLDGILRYCPTYP
jgi:hypothetical protein